MGLCRASSTLNVITTVFQEDTATCRCGWHDELRALHHHLGAVAAAPGAGAGGADQLLSGTGIHPLGQRSGVHCLCPRVRRGPRKVGLLRQKFQADHDNLR